ncbi:alpha/beta fold hydrolase [Actinopolymorpha pittospori]|uniref:Pimeloyl-ACP methyl ester carboxylesterase n=1 Tax=Actinopolymorpha pittospori TaxID=648752 RepID=A0A927RC36_9ACTN|nr:alpha/beta hydrolase [Actinopolymorpha pittospori]MBE1606720.1 pimeloyl-ACP methyl ester carboxylesterase [Actinopolymorpha pittospori]
MTYLERSIVVDGVRLAYTDRGQGEPVVFVHGTPSHSYLWREVLPAVRAAGHRVLAYDLLGYGASERPLDRDTSVEAQADLLDRFLTALGLDAVNLVAHDIGGAVGQILAVDRPARVRRLILLDTVSYDSWPSATWRDVVDEYLDDVHVGAQEFERMLTGQLEQAVHDPRRMSGDVLAAYLGACRGRLGRASFFEHQVRHYDAAPTMRVAPRLHELRIPVRVVWGAADRWQPVGYAERLAGDIPGADLVVVPDAGHFLPEDAPSAVAEQVRELLAVDVSPPQG